MITMENKVWISLAVVSLLVLSILASDFSNTYDPLRYSAPNLNVDRLNREVPHSRRKRAIQDVPDVPANEHTPDNMTIYMYKTGEYENVTEMRVGSRMCFLLAAHFPAETTDFLVELFTPDNETTVMAIYDVEVDYGTNLNMDNNPVNIVYESKDEDVAANRWRPDRVVLDFGNVSNIAAATDYKQNIIQITWCIVMVDANGTENGTTLWASAGADYYSELEIWIGQASFTAITDDPGSFGTPTFNFSGPNEIEIGTTGSFIIDMVNTYPSKEISIDVFAPLNDTGYMSVCTLAVSDVGETYAVRACLDKAAKNKENNKLVFFESSHELGGTFRAHLDLDTVIATGFYDNEFPSDEKRTIRIEFQIGVLDDEQYIGNVDWIGAAIELGDTQIWAGQIQVTVANRTDMALTLATDPEITVTTVTDPYQVGKYYAVKYYVDINLPEDSISDYVLEILAPINETAQMKICTVTPMDDYAGVNVPCVRNKAEYFSRSDNETVDRAVFNMGRLLNNGARKAADDADANRLRILVVAQLLDHELLVDGDKVWLTAGLVYSNDETLYVGMNAIVYNQTKDNDTSIETPDITMVYTAGNESIPVGGVGSINITITTKRGTMYLPMDMEIILPYENDTALFSMCRAEITYVGENMPCMEKEKVNASISYTSKGNNNTMDKAVINLGPLCNVGDESKTEPTDDDKMVITFSFKVEEHDNNTVGSEQWVSAGLMFHEARLWVGMLKTIVTDTPEGYTNEQPHIELNRTTSASSTDIGIGQSVVYNMTIQIPHKTQANWKVSVEAGDDKLAVCVMRIAEVGWYLPCVNSSIKSNVTNYWEGTYGRSNARLELDMGIITNVGELPKTDDSFFGNHTIRLSIMVYASRKASVSDTVQFTVTANADGMPQFQEIISLNVINSVVESTENETVPEFSFYAMPIGGDTNENISRIVNDSVEIPKGGATQFRIDITNPSMSSNKMTVKYLSPVNTSGIMEVTDITVTHVGENYPCQDRLGFVEYEEPVVTRTDAVYDDLADIRSLDLGYLCHFPVVQDDPTADMITVEGIMSVPKNAPVNDGHQEWASVTVRINDDQIYVAQMLVTIRDDFNETIYEKSIEELVSNYTDGYDPWRFETAGRYTIPYIVTVAPNQTIKAMVDVKFPVNQTAVGVVEELKLVEAGRNLALLNATLFRPDPNNTNFNIEFYSELNNTQNDSCFMDIGPITNTGVTYRRNDFKEEDNQLKFEASVWIADAAVFEENTTHYLSAGAKVGSVIIILDSPFEPARTGSERPDLCLAVSLNTTETFETEVPAEFTFKIEHTNISTAEAYNVTLAFYFTGFLNYSGIDYCNVSEVLEETPEVEIDNSALRKVKFTFEKILFTDNVDCVIKLESNDGFDAIPSTESGTPQNATTPYEALFQKIYRQDSLYDEGHWFFVSMDYITPDVAVPGGVSCNEIRIIQDTGFQDCQITGSYSEPDYLPHKARWDSGSNWKPKVRQSTDTSFPTYIDIALGNITKVTKVHVGYTGSNDRVGIAKAYYSMDGINYLVGEDMDFDAGYSDGYVYSMVSPQEARHIRFVLAEPETALKTDPQYEVRFELEGCVISSDISPEDVCQSNEWDYQITSALESDYYPRGFLVGYSATDQAYICDLNPNLGKDFKWTDWNKMVNENAQMVCYESADGNTYNTVDPQVINVIGFYKPTPVPGETLPDELFAIDRTKRALLVSEDGVTFRSCDIARLEKRKTSTEGTFTEAVSLDWVSSGDFGPGVVPTGDFVQGSWKATYDGMEFGTTKKLDWSVCCL